MSCARDASHAPSAASPLREGRRWLGGAAFDVRQEAQAVVFLFRKYLPDYM